MRTSDAGIDLIKSFEGFSPIAYRDVAGILTIGYGTTAGVKEDQVTSEEDAETRLRADLIHFENGIEHFVKVSLTQNQYDALVSLIYNIGLSNFVTSTLRRKLNGGFYQAAADWFLVWNKATIDGKLTSVPGLVRRRMRERELFLTP
jgi:lysozyme